MDLPVELRLEIAEYAMTADFLFYWRWKRRALAGSFDLDHDFRGRRVVKYLNALSLVSRQLHIETKGIVWKMNTFSFDQDVLEERRHERLPNDVENEDIHPVVEALQFVLKMLPSTLKIFPTIVMETRFIVYPGVMMEEFQRAHISRHSTLVRGSTCRPASPS
jgi:hypothetical protein